jgi:ABC-type multidrug transport system fused ATPase/permease subunit
MQNVRDNARETYRLMGGKSVGWLLLRLVASLVYTATEYGLTLVLVVFLFTLELVQTAQFPAWMPAAWLAMPPPVVWGGMAAIGVLRALSQLVSRQAGHASLELVRARLKMMQGYAMLIAESEHATSLAEVNLHMTEFIPRASDYIYHLAELVSVLVQSLALALGMLWLTWQLTLTGILLLGLVGVLIFRLNRMLSKVSARIPEERALLERSIVRICRNWLLIRILHIQEREYTSYGGSVGQYYHLSTRAFYYGNISGVLPPLFGILILVVMIQANYALFHIAPIALVAFIYLFFRFTQSTVAITDHAGYLQRYKIHFQEVMREFAALSEQEVGVATGMTDRFSMLARNAQLAGRSPTPAVNVAVSQVASAAQPPAIEVRGLDFRWPGAQKEIFRDFSLHIQAGSQFGIVGPNGSGKSTLLSILLGVLQPMSGEVLIGGVASRDYVHESRRIGYVSDDPYLILGTIRENLLYGAERRIEDAEIYEILRSVGMRDDILEMPRGLDTALRENGEGLSSGQKQRLALARAFLRDPILLILDEASANLDRAVEVEIADILNDLKGHCTTLIVSHKPEIIRHADDVLDLGAYRLAAKN